jgi:hypothetical protein
MGLTTLPTRSEDSVGATKTNAYALRVAGVKGLTAAQYNVLADAVVDVAAEVGKHDGSTAGSLVARATALEAVPAVTLSASSALANERVLTAGSGITLTDGGAGSTVTVACSGPQGIFRFNDTSTAQFGSVVKIAPTVGGSVVLSVTTTAGVPRLVMTGTNNGGVHCFPMTLTGARSRRFRFSFTQHSNVPGSGGFQVGLLASDDSTCIGYLHDTGGHSIIQVWAASNTSTAFLSTSPAWSGNNPLRYVIDFDVPTGAVATGDEIAMTRAVCPANGAEVKQYRRTTINANLNGKTFDRLFIATSDLDPTTDDDTFHFSDIRVDNL